MSCRHMGPHGCMLCPDAEKNNMRHTALVISIGTKEGDQFFLITCFACKGCYCTYMIDM